MAFSLDTMEQTLERLLLEREIEQFLYNEAELLDERRFSEWIDLIADDMHYHMPIRRNVKFGEHHRENSDSDSEISWFDEGKETLAGRVRQINTGIHWFPLWMAIVCPTNSGVITERRDHVLITFFFFPFSISETFLRSFSSINGPFFTERANFTFSF